MSPFEANQHDRNVIPINVANRNPQHSAPQGGRSPNNIRAISREK